MFELNQSGIETVFNTSTTSLTSLSFELNQSGIETNRRETFSKLQMNVWIEPKWNWDSSLFGGAVNAYRIGFELNQSGIETARHIPEYSTPQLRRLNWTKVELRL